MKDILNEVLLTEKKVEELLQKARVEASEIKLKTEKEIAQKIEEARKKAREIIRKKVEKVKKDAEYTRSKMLEDADRENNELIDKNRVGIEEVVQEIVKIIVATGYE
jgi:F0F1-type ATP synthase membrane subunit b/b'